MMERKYKEVAIICLYGLIEGSPVHVRNNIKESFIRKFCIEVDAEVTSTDRFTIEGDEHYKGCWIGSMTATIKIDGEEYSVTRDWGKEYDIDIKHPDYETDDWFYEGDKCQSHQSYLELMKELDDDNTK